jgi:uncharacterized protein YkwD
MRKLLAVAVAVVALLLVACTPAEGAHMKQVNDFRVANHVPGLIWEEAAYAKAHAWSQHMADEGRLSHSTLSQGMPAGWHTLGENVAMAGSLDAAMDALEKSPPHRANLLNPAFTRVAIGVAEKNGYVWVTEVFIG